MVCSRNWNCCFHICSCRAAVALDTNRHSSFFKLFFNFDLYVFSQSSRYCHQKSWKRIESSERISSTAGSPSANAMFRTDSDLFATSFAITRSSCTSMLFVILSIAASILSRVAAPSKFRLIVSVNPVLSNSSEITVGSLGKMLYTFSLKIAVLLRNRRTIRSFLYSLRRGRFTLRASIFYRRAKSRRCA